MSRRDKKFFSEEDYKFVDILFDGIKEKFPEVTMISVSKGTYGDIAIGAEFRINKDRHLATISLQGDVRILR